MNSLASARTRSDRSGQHLEFQREKHEDTLRERDRVEQRFIEKLDLDKERLSRLHGDEYKNVMEILDVDIKLDRVEENWPSFRRKMEPKWGGAPLHGRLNELMKKVGWDDPEITTFASMLVDLEGTYLTMMTGTQRGMEEKKWLAAAMLQVHNGTKTFEWLLASIKQRTKDHGIVVRDMLDIGRTRQGASSLLSDKVIDPVPEGVGPQKQTPTGSGPAEDTASAGEVFPKTINVYSKKLKKTQRVTVNSPEELDMFKKAPDEWEIR
jgi:hypothetical protein